MGKYSYCCGEMFLREDNPRRPGRAGTWIFGQEFKGQAYMEQAPNMVEILGIMGSPRAFKREAMTWATIRAVPFPNITAAATRR